MVTLALAFLRGQWKWVIPTIALVVVTGLLGLSRYQYKSLKADVASQEAARLALVNQLNQAHREMESQQAEFAIKLDQEHAQAVEVVNSVIADHARRFTDELRRAKRACNPNGVPVTAPGSGVPPGSSAGSENGLLDRAGRDFAELGARANKLAEFAKACVKWAGGVGR